MNLTPQYCQNLTFPQAWRKLGELNDPSSPRIAYDKVPAAFLPDLKRFVVGQTQSGEYVEGEVDRAVYVKWLLKVFNSGIDYEIIFKTESTETKELPEPDESGPYTPGPWVQGQKDSWGRHMNVYAHSEKIGRASRIVDCNPGFSNDFSEEEKTANARLIATAPDLLQALKMLLTSFETLVWDAHEEIEVINAHNIIKKATQQ